MPFKHFTHFNHLRYLKRTFFLFSLIFTNSYFLKAQNNPIANSASIIKSGNARFTVLTAGLIRLEWDSTGVFENEATHVVINRNLKKPDFTIQENAKKLIIKTSKLSLEYIKGNKKFDAANLTITSAKGLKKFSWNLGVKDIGNLKGTAKTLDGYNGETADTDNSKKLELEDGLLSTLGWHLLDDSKTYLLDNSELPWVKERKSYTTQDYYFFAYGSDYKAALYDYTLVAGKVPLPPRYAFGYWWSRYYAYSDNELRTLVTNFEKNDVPLDVLVIDMDWHPSDDAYKPNPRRDLSGSRRGWTGYTWNKKLFPQPEKFLQWTAEKNLKITLNLHPASGIPFTEEKYPEFAKIMNFDTTGVTGKKVQVNNPFIKWPVFDEIGYRDIPYEGSDKKFMNTLFDVVLHPLEKTGVDFWWLDWQQYKYSNVMKNLDNTWWLNHVFFKKMQLKNQERPMIYHRWGGMGNHRYQIGFSGDAIISWKMLAYEPYFTSTSSNVLYGYWSHDIGGHMKGRDTTDKTDWSQNPELYTRWVQYGVYSPILRTHSTTGVRMSRAPWDFTPKYGNVIKNYINLRYQLAPYIYSMARKTYDTGISLCRPLYYDYPDAKEAYTNKSEYLFGDDMLIAPIGTPLLNDVSSIKVWLPQGTWIEQSTGNRFTGNQTIERNYTLDEYPVFVKEGAVIPTYPNLKNLKHNCDTLILKVYGKANNEGILYEDAGDDDQYLKGSYSTRKFISGLKGKNVQTLSISTTKGRFNGMSESKLFFVEFPSNQMPEDVKVNGQAIPFSNNQNATYSWSFSGEEMTLRVKLPSVKNADSVVINVTYPQNNIDVNGLPGKMKKAKNILSYLRANVPAEAIPNNFFTAGELALNINYQPENGNVLVSDFLATYAKMEDMINSLKIDAKHKDKVIGMLKF